MSVRRDDKANPPLGPATARQRRSWRVAVAVSRFNEAITDNLLACCLEELQAQGLKDSNIDVRLVPGAYELPFVANRLARSRRYQAVICLGCILKGETSHDLHIATWAAIGIGQIGLATGVPTLFGVLTPNSEEQGLERSRPGPRNRGKEVAQAAIEMIHLVKRGV